MHRTVQLQVEDHHIDFRRIAFQSLVHSTFPVQNQNTYMKYMILPETESLAHPCTHPSVKCTVKAASARDTFMVLLNAEGGSLVCNMGLFLKKILGWWCTVTISTHRDSWNNCSIHDLLLSPNFVLHCHSFQAAVETLHEKQHMGHT